MYSDSVRTYASAYRFNIFISRINCNFRTRSCLTCNRFYYNDSFLDFRNFQLQKPFQKAWMRSGKKNLRTFANLPDFSDICFNSVANLKVFAMNLFRRHQNSFCLVHCENNISVLDSLDSTGNNVICAVVVFIVDNSAFCLANFLHNKLLCCLRRDSSERTGRNFIANSIANFIVRIDFLCIGKGNFFRLVRHFLDNCTQFKHFKLSCLSIQVDKNIFIRAVVFFVRENQR